MKRILQALFVVLLLATSQSYAAPKCKAKKNQIVKYDSHKRRCVYKKCVIKSGFSLSIKSNKCNYQELAVPTPIPTQNPLGNWKISTSTDSLDGSLITNAQLVSNNAQSILLVTCHNNIVRFGYASGTFLSLSTIYVDVRADSTIYPNDRWDSALQGKGAFWPYALETLTILDTIKNSQEIFIRATGLLGYQSEASFSPSGMVLAVDAIKQACPGSIQKCPLNSVSVSCVLDNN